jgi:hypothetical protein
MSCSLNEPIVNIQPILASLPGLLPQNYIDVWFRSMNSNNLSNLVVSVLPYSLPFLILAGVIAIAWVGCCFQMCCGRVFKACANRRYSASDISVCACLTFFTVLATFMLTIFVILVAFDFKNATTNILCRASNTTTQMVNG